MLLARIPFGGTSPGPDPSIPEMSNSSNPPAKPWFSLKENRKVSPQNFGE